MLLHKTIENSSKMFQNNLKHSTLLFSFSQLVIVNRQRESNEILKQKHLEG